MPTLYFPEDPHLEHLRGQARTLLRELREGDEQAVALFVEHHPRPPAAPRLADAQLALARGYGFTSWPDLRRHLDVVARHTRSPHEVAAADEPAAELLRLGCLRYGGDDLLDHARATAMLAADPALSSASIHAAAATGDPAATGRVLAADPGRGDPLRRPVRLGTAAVPGLLPHRRPRRRLPRRRPAAAAPRRRPGLGLPVGRHLRLHRVDRRVRRR
jgi:hypothetical protein